MDEELKDYFNENVEVKTYRENNDMILKFTCSNAIFIISGTDYKIDKKIKARINGLMKSLNFELSSGMFGNRSNEIEIKINGISLIVKRPDRNDFLITDSTISNIKGIAKSMVGFKNPFIETIGVEKSIRFENDKLNVSISLKNGKLVESDSEFEKLIITALSDLSIKQG